MPISNDGIKLVKQFESCKLKSYLCPAGKLTVGYGHTSDAGPPKVVAGMTITLAEADEILRKDLEKFLDAVVEHVRVPLTWHQRDALVSFVFNVGEAQFSRSTLLKKLNRGDYEAVPTELMRWNKANGKELAGLTRRRRAEAKLWRGLDATPDREEAVRVAPDAPKPRKKITQSREANAALAGGGMSLLAAGAEATGYTKQIAESFEIPVVAILILAALVFAAIWWFRKQRLEENGE